MHYWYIIAVTVGDLPAINAGLNSCATLLLLLGWYFIKRGRIVAHRNLMLAAFAVSVIFLACYVAYHLQSTLVRKFPEYPPTAVRYGYYAMLLTHVVLAAVVPFLAV